MPTKPNLIFIMPDQLRADFLGCYGADFIETPHIDSLAERGVRYERAYSTSPICVPARAALLTGRNALKNGVTDNGQWLRPDLADCGIRTWPELLNEQGYYTAAIGKMHFYPWDIKHGFQYRVAAEDKRWLHVRDDYYHFLQERGHRKYHGNEHEGYYENKGAIIDKLPWELSVDHFVGQEACRFIQAYGGETPFAMMVGFPGPHCPYDPNEGWLEGVEEEKLPKAIPEVPGNAPKLRQANINGNRMPWNGVDYTEFTEAQKHKIRLHYAAEVRQIDYEVGQILAGLKEKGLLKNTVIIFTSDHGDYLGDHNLIGKGSFYEGSIKVPMIVHLPWAEEARVYKGLVELTDITATLMQYAGCELPGYMDSKPLPDLEVSGQSHKDHLFGATSGGWMIYDGTWKLAKYSSGEVHLFNLDDDPTEQKNLLNDPRHKEKYLALDALLTQEVLRAIRDSHEPQRVYTSTLSSDPGFGKEGWQRTYPQDISKTIR